MDKSKSVHNAILDRSDFLDKLSNSSSGMKKSTGLSEKYRLEGNKLFNQGQHSLAEHKRLLNLYSQSVSYAPRDSEELAKGYSNRSALLMHIQRYQEALIDIDRALIVTKSDVLKDKLGSRRKRCLKLLNESKRSPSNELPTMQPSVMLPSASEAVGINYNKKFGRHLVATRDIEAGEVVISEEGYMCFPSGLDRVYITCSHCMKFAWNGVPCDTCVLAMFCSEQCKNEAWQEYHDKECSFIRIMFLTTNEDEISKVMVTMRSFIKAVKSEGFGNIINESMISNENKDHVKKLLSNGILDSKKFRSYFNLQFKTDDEDKQSNVVNALDTVSIIHKYTNIIPFGNLEDFDSLDEKLLLISTEIVMTLHDVVARNQFIHEEQYCDCVSYETMACKGLCNRNRGIVLAATSSLINHSCCANVGKMHFSGKKIVMYTTVPIKKGQQLCHSYGSLPIAIEKKVRQKYLKENCFFLCKCQACEENWPNDIHGELDKHSIENEPRFDMFLKDFQSYFSNPNLSYHDILNRKPDIIASSSTDQWHPEKSMLDKVIKLFELIHKYFNYRIAYYHCWKMSVYIELSYAQLYRDDYVMPKCC